MKEHKNNTFGKKVPFLANVCWLNSFAVAENVAPAKYNLYILHGISSDSNMTSQATISVEISLPQSNKPTLLYKDDFIKESDFQLMRPDTMEKTFIVQIDLQQFKNEQLNVRISI